jgi:hypothetical protein
VPAPSGRLCPLARLPAAGAAELLIDQVPVTWEVTGTYVKLRSFIARVIERARGRCREMGEVSCEKISTAYRACEARNGERRRRARKRCWGPGSGNCFFDFFSSWPLCSGGPTRRETRFLRANLCSTLYYTPPSGLCQGRFGFRDVGRHTLSNSSVFLSLSASNESGQGLHTCTAKAMPVTSSLCNNSPCPPLSSGTPSGNLIQ